VAVYNRKRPCLEGTAAAAGSDTATAAEHLPFPPLPPPQ
jgi:hypothetical protein